jgi:nucleoside-diphosphate-sugar epimerase
VLGSGSIDVGVEDNKSRFHLATMDQVLASSPSFRDVVFCAPPSGFEDYSSAVNEAATRLWTGIHGTGRGVGGEEVGSFVFTSSGAVYEGIDGETVDELSPTVSDPNSNPRAYRMVQAENAAIQHGGCALRLAGLYTLERGAHNYWLDTSSSNGGTAATAKGRKTLGRGDGIVNLLHYDDAASAVLAALIVGPNVNSGRRFLISDGNPTTRRGICESAIKHARYRECTTMPPFLEVEKDGVDEAGPRGKVYDGRKSNEALEWKPKYASFDEFMTL